MNKIVLEDVSRVATHLNMDITLKQAQQIVVEHEGACVDDPTSTWWEVVESQLYSLVQTESQLSAFIEVIRCTQFPEAVLERELEELIHGKESFIDTDESMGERMFLISVFEDLIIENPKLGNKARMQLDFLANTGTEYIHLIK